MLYYIYKENNRIIIKVCFTVFIILTCFYGITGFVNRKIHIMKTGVIGKEGFYHLLIDKETLEILHQLDNSLEEGNNIFYVTSPEIALEIKKNRYIVSQAELHSIEMLSSRSYLGTVDNLILFLQKSLKDKGKEKAITSSFKDYKDFRLINETGRFKVLLGVARSEKKNE